jgi:hypothetical protein
MACKLVIVGTHSVAITVGTMITCLAQFNTYKTRGDRASTLLVALYNNDGQCLEAYSPRELYEKAPELDTPVERYLTLFDASH